MAVGWHAENNLVRGDAGGFPACDGIFGGSLVVASVAGPVEGGVGSSGCQPGAPDVVVLDMS
jgi:hypothetical protein